MGSRDVPFDEYVKCDDCGAWGAYDFMGDFYCARCVDKHVHVCTPEDAEVLVDALLRPPEGKNDE